MLFKIVISCSFKARCTRFLYVQGNKSWTNVPKCGFQRFYTLGSKSSLITEIGSNTCISKPLLVFFEYLITFQLLIKSSCFFCSILKFMMGVTKSLGAKFIQMLAEPAHINFFNFFVITTMLMSPILLINVYFILCIKTIAPLTGID